jgi:beta-glucosidase
MGLGQQPGNRFERRAKRRSAARSRAFARIVLTTCLTGALVAGGTVAGVSAQTQTQVAFATQQGGTYAGLPLFDGVPAHLEAYLDTLLDYAGLEAAVNWANGRRGDFTIPSGSNRGRVVPGAPQWGEGVQGISTDFPSIQGMGQTWNTELVRDIGAVIGDEKLYTQSWSKSLSDYNATLAAGMGDLRPNPLSGRVDESFGEDEEFASDLLTAYSTGATGVDEESNGEGFWSKAVLVTKHFSGYNAQWFRRPGNFDISTRAQLEYWSQPPQKGFASGSISGIITSYGRTNGIPNSISPLIDAAQQKSPWGGMYTTPDNGAENRLHVANAYGNGFDDRYTPTWADAVALFPLAEAGSIAATGASVDRNTELLAGLQSGKYGITAQDVLDVARDQLAPLVRVGLFNERDAQGLPKDYPFAQLSAAAASRIDYTAPEHQAVALSAAQEGIVLLKNDDHLLPLAKDASLAVSGPLADARFRTTYAIGTPTLPNAGLTPRKGIDAVSDGDISFATDGKVVRLRSVANGQYLTLGTEAAPTLNASSADAAAAATFESFDWGQEAYGFRSTTSGKWLQYTSNAVNVGQTAELGTAATTLPSRIRPVDNGDGTVSFVVDAYTESFGGGFETRYYSNGRYLTVDANGRVGVTAALGTAQNAAALKTDAAKFAIETVSAAGTASVAAGSDYAVVVVGAPARNSAGEGADRSTLELGPQQYELVNNVAAAYPGRTVVVVSTSAPVDVAAIDANPNVKAIVQAPEGGQYGGLALGKVLFGDYAPTGRLAQTWYAGDDALPQIDEHSIPEGPNNVTTLSGIDPRFTVDMVNGDPQSSRLTYKYTEADTTYEFGYGLSYSSFSYSDLNVSRSTDAFTATVKVTNTGDVATSDVVQLYAKNPGSTYGSAAPQRQLVAFAKAAVAPGETKEVALTFAPDALALWDVSSNALNVESGTYTFEVGHSSSDIADSIDLAVTGTGFTPTASKGAMNVFDHSFASSGVYYREASKQNTVNGLRDDKLVAGYYSVGSRIAGGWTAINDLDLSNAKAVTLSLGSTNANTAGVELRLDSPDGRSIGHFDIANTGASSYSIPATDLAAAIPVRELAYKDVTAAVPADVTGVHDVYLMFSAPDVRARDFTVEPRVAPTVQVAVSTKCTAGKVFVNVTAKNTNAFPTDITIETAYGSKTFPDVAAGKSATQAFTTRQATIPAGETTVTANATVDGVLGSTTVSSPHAATTCK